MSEYRVYGLDVRSHIVRTAYFHANSDEEAIEWARGWSPTTNRELWQGRRKVLVVPAVRPETTSIAPGGSRDGPKSLMFAAPEQGRP